MPAKKSLIADIRHLTQEELLCPKCGAAYSESYAVCGNPGCWTVPNENVKPGETWKGAVGTPLARRPVKKTLVQLAKTDENGDPVRMGGNIVGAGEAVVFAGHLSEADAVKMLFGK